MSEKGGRKGGEKSGVACCARQKKAKTLTCEVCRASSRVGTRIIDWMLGLLASAFSSTGMTKAAVFPVPFFARARMSRPARAIGMLSSWMGEGRSKPASKMPISNSRLRK